MKRAYALLSAALTTLQVACQSPPVKVALRSSWPAPPFLTEILETVSLENPEAFFTYLDQLTDPQLLGDAITAAPEAVHQGALAIAIDYGVIQEPEALAAVQMNLAMHAATPKLEAFYNYYADHHNGSSGNECGSWVDWYGEVVCDVERLAQLAGIEAIEASIDIPVQPRPKILTFDHIFPPPSRVIERPPRCAIFYASLTSPNFREIHTYLLKLANRPDPHVEYVFRHIPPSKASISRNYLSGYGVALDLKKMDYLALDDRSANALGGNVAGVRETQENRVDPILPLILNHPENLTAPDSTVPLTTVEIYGLGPQVVQIISEASDPLLALTHLSQNFPKYATTLVRRVVASQNVTDELHENALRAQRGVNVFWLNGLQVDQKDVHPFGLLRMLKKDKDILKSLTSQGLTRAQAFELLTHPDVAAAQKENAMLDTLFDASDRPEGGDIIVWWNDMEKDNRYKRWNPSLYGLLRPMYPGMMPNIKANLFNVVLTLDLSKMSSLNFLAGPMSNIINREFPLRFGLVPVGDGEAGKKMVRLFYYLITNHGRKSTLEFLRAISQVQVPPGQETETVQWDKVNSAWEFLAEKTEQEKPDVELPELKAILTGDFSSPAPFDKIAAYTERLGCGLESSPTGHAFFNGKHFDIKDDFLTHLQNEMAVQMRIFQEKVYEGSLSDDNKGESMGDYFYDLPTTNKRRNRYIYPSAGSLRIVNLPEVFAKTGFRASPPTYLYPPGWESVSESLYVVADLDSEAGLKLVKEALISLTPESKTRISLIHNPTVFQSGNSEPRLTISLLVAHLHMRGLLSKADPATLLSALGVEAPAAPLDGPQIPVGRKSAFEILAEGISLKDIKQDEYANYVKESLLASRAFQVLPGQSALVVNGRVVGPIEGDFRVADFKALEDYEFRKRTEPVLKALQSVAASILEDKYLAADIISLAASVVASTQQPDPSESGLFDAPLRPRSRGYDLLLREYTAFESGDNSTALHRIAVLVDPLSETAQKWSSLLKWLSNIPDTFIQIHLSPTQYTDIPLKKFYRSNLLPSLSFDKNGQEIPAQAVFEDLPVDPIYTLAMDVPTSWLVRPREALYDLDNIQLGKLFPGDSSVEATFELDYIVIEGHAREAVNQNPPRGVQLQLAAGDGSPVDDTQVVANLGYFQFKAKPGVFQLEIRPGRSRGIFKLDSAGNEGWESPSIEEAGNEITVTRFEGLTLYPRLSRLPGQAAADVLREEAKEEGSKGLFEDLFSKVMNIFKSSKKEPSTDVIAVKPQADINIFTVASGLLYERFVGIMILSVLRNTNSTVKFWFIENFLSSSFLEFIPHMAEQYNFQYELVTYKWPSWLRAQTEKQRIIWAYKILFLDVLFPMDLKKVIFVDADQIVRADLKELVDLDLHGAPYGYTPMGDDNTDMEGFRFWKTGYWKDFLQGKPYHISALYVIDLVRFRQLAAGDILRQHYHQLSADPNSLANLDQDLPNNLQSHVPIFSLPEDWLWCETWCSKDRLHRAKTIDLCQNPLTKEPKLARARQIPEWEEYDAEIARFTRDLAAQGKVHSRMATADANVLAGAGPGVGAAAEEIPVAVESPVVESDGDREGKEEPVRDEL